MGDAGLEQCGFVISFLLFPIGLFYILGQVMPDPNQSPLDSNNNTDHSVVLDVSTSAYCLFVAVPLLYALCNRLTNPKMDSESNLYDEYTREPPEKQIYSKQRAIPREHVPGICDFDIAQLNQIMSQKVLDKKK